MKKLLSLLLLTPALLHGANIHDLFHAIERENEKKVEEIVQKNPQLVNVQDETGQTPLYKAASQGNSDIVKLLLDEGANPNIQNNSGWTPLYEAVFFGHITIVQLLLNRGANPDIQNKWQRTPLRWAIFKARNDIVKLLLDKGANPNIKDDDGWTPLDLAIFHGNKNMVKLLLAYDKTDLTINKSVLNSAQTKGYGRITQIIKKHRATREEKSIQKHGQAILQVNNKLLDINFRFK